MEENNVKYKDILIYLKGVYSAKAEKYTAEMAELTKNFEVIAERRSTLRGKVKEAVAVVEEEKNKHDQMRTREDRPLTGSQREGGGGEERQLKHPQGAHSYRISSEFTPFMAQNWAALMRLYIKTCSNLEILSTDKQWTLCKIFVSLALWPMVELNRSDRMQVMVKRVKEAFERLQLVFARKVKLLELMIMKGEGYIEWANRINQQSELARMEGISAHNLQFMKYCQRLHKTDRLFNKLMDIAVKSWATAQEIIRQYVQSQALKADMVESTPKNQGNVVMKMSGFSSPAPRPSIQLPGKQRKKYDSSSHPRGRDRTRGGEVQGGGRRS